MKISLWMPTCIDGAAQEDQLMRYAQKSVFALIALFAFFSLSPLAHGQRLLPGPERNTLARAPNGLGAKKVAAILFNYADNPGNQPITPADTRRRLFTD